MGVDIYGWSKVRLAENQTFNADGEPLEGEDAHVIYINDAFPGRLTEWPHKSVVVVDGDYEHCYSRAYSGYNRWRDELAKLAGYPLTEYEGYAGSKSSCYAAGAWEVLEGPFWELINFSDCEGMIGTAICQKLAKDFADWQERADLVEDEHWRQGYAGMRKAFEIGSNGGLVRFG